MQRTGSANLPLHGGKAPRWLFKRMIGMSGAIAGIMVEEYGTEGLLERLADPYWFQSLACAIGFDWHSSGTTTVTMGAMKEALGRDEMGVRIAGGKGKASLKRPEEVKRFGREMDYSEEMVEDVTRASRLAAKVDSAAIQDGYNLYHHTIAFDEEGNWAVIQQGLMESNGYARRYHWLGRDTGMFSEEPGTRIAGHEEESVLNLTAGESGGARRVSMDLVNDGVGHLQRDIKMLSRQRTLDNFMEKRINPPPHLEMPVTVNWSAVKEAYEFQPENYDELISTRGIGAATIRALALVSELIYGERASWKDPVKYSFAVGGKDGVPYPVDKRAMDDSIEILEDALNRAKIDDKERLKAIKRLKSLNRRTRTQSFSDYATPDTRIH